MTVRAAQGTARTGVGPGEEMHVGTEPSRRVEVDVSQQVALTCVDDRGTSAAVDTVFGYVRSDPYAVTITFRSAAGDLPWSFARDLLVAGVGAPAGIGDVHVWPSVSDQGRAVLTLELASPDGRLLARARADEVHRFLTRTLALVPAGTESDHLDLDGLVARLLPD